MEKRDMTLYINGLNEIGSLLSHPFLSRAIIEETIKAIFIDNYLENCDVMSTGKEASLKVIEIMRQV